MLAQVCCVERLQQAATSSLLLSDLDPFPGRFFLSFLNISLSFSVIYIVLQFLLEFVVLEFVTVCPFQPESGPSRLAEVNNL